MTKAFIPESCFECPSRPSGKKTCDQSGVCERYEAWEDNDNLWPEMPIPTEHGPPQTKKSTKPQTKKSTKPQTKKSKKTNVGSPDVVAILEQEKARLLRKASCIDETIKILNQ